MFKKNPEKLLRNILLTSSLLVSFNLQSFQEINSISNSNILNYRDARDFFNGIQYQKPKIKFDNVLKCYVVEESSLYFSTQNNSYYIENYEYCDFDNGKYDLNSYGGDSISFLVRTFNRKTGENTWDHHAYVNFGKAYIHFVKNDSQNYNIPDNNHEFSSQQLIYWLINYLNISSENLDTSLFKYNL